MSFAKEIRAYTDKTQANLRIVAQESIQEVLDIAQTPKAKGGRMPVVTSFLRNSLASGLNGSFGEPASDSYLLTIAGLEIGDIAQFGWTAEYALRIEYGFNGQDSLGRRYNQQGAYFVGTAAAQWPQIVDRIAGELG